MSGRIFSKVLNEFIEIESISATLLLLSAILALIFANTRFSTAYHYILSYPLHLPLLPLTHTVKEWINDGLMALYFLIIGLEMKREIIVGELNRLHKIMLPGIAAIGGVMLPAAIYYFINHGNHEAIKGWAIPTATDIAFSLGILSN